MTETTETKDSLRALIERLERDLRLCDEKGYSAAAVDLNQAIEKLKKNFPKYLRLIFGSIH